MLHYDVLVIGSGPAGEAGAVQAAFFGKKVALVDETAHLTRPGLVSFIAPDVAPRALAPINDATADRIRVTDALAAAKFRPRDRIVVGRGRRARWRSFAGSRAR